MGKGGREGGREGDVGERKRGVKGRRVGVDGGGRLVRGKERGGRNGQIPLGAMHTRNSVQLTFDPSVLYRSDQRSLCEGEEEEEAGMMRGREGDHHTDNGAVH